MKLIDKKNKTSLSELKKLAEKNFGFLVKAVVDIKKELIVISGELHCDEEKLLLEKGSKQQDLWGINLYPNNHKKDFIEFDSMINIRPKQNNFSRGVENKKVQHEIIKLVWQLMHE